MYPPEIDKSTKKEREQYIKEKFACRSNCEMCGICKVLKGKSAEAAYSDYIEGKREFVDVAADYR